MTRTRILIAEDHRMVREGFYALLTADPDFEVVGQVADGRAAIAAAQRLMPDVILMDIAMPLLNGLEATRKIMVIMPTCKILILSAHGDDAYIDHAFAAGAVGFLLKQISSEEVCSSIRSVMAGHICVESTWVFQGPLESYRPEKRSSRLTPREVEVLQMIAEGSGNKHIAVNLEISIKTVEKHRSNLMAKLHIHDTAGLTRHAITIGLIESTLQVTIIDTEATLPGVGQNRLT